MKRSRELPRTRRLNADIDEETALLASCAPHLRATVEAALETGMRRGEISSLQWSQVEGMRIEGGDVRWHARAEIFLPATKTKTNRDRRIPISTRLKGILEMRQLDPAGNPIPLAGYVFGNEIGQRVMSTKRACSRAVLEAHGHEPTYTRTMNLTPESRAAMSAIDLESVI